MAVENPPSLFLQDVCPQFRRTLLAEHDRHVRKAKREHLLLRSGDGEPGSEENDDENEQENENDGQSPSKRLCTSCEDDSLSTARETPAPIPTQAVVPLNEPRALRGKVVEKYLSLGRALFNDHDTMGTLYLLHYPNHYENVKQINRVWTPVFNPTLRKNVPLLLSSTELHGITRSVEFLQNLFEKYPDCVTTHESKVSAATPYGEKVVVKQRFFGTKVLPPARANRVVSDVERKSVSSSFPSFSLSSSSSSSSSAPIDVVTNPNLNADTNTVTHSTHSDTDKTQASVKDDSGTITTHSTANNLETTVSVPLCSSSLSTSNILDICYYTTIFFDQQNKVYEIWHDSVIPTPPELLSPLNSI